MIRTDWFRAIILNFRNQQVTFLGSLYPLWNGSELSAEKEEVVLQVLETPFSVSLPRGQEYFQDGEWGLNQHLCPCRPSAITKSGAFGLSSSVLELTREKDLKMCEENEI